MLNINDNEPEFKKKDYAVQMREVIYEFTLGGPWVVRFVLLCLYMFSSPSLSSSISVVPAFCNGVKWADILGEHMKLFAAGILFCFRKRKLEVLALSKACNEFRNATACIISLSEITLRCYDGVFVMNY